jgi:hypothetical protein
MRCDSWASLLAYNLTSPYLGHKPKARVATPFTYLIIYFTAFKWEFRV